MTLKIFNTTFEFNTYDHWYSLQKKFSIGFTYHYPVLTNINKGKIWGISKSFDILFGSKIYNLHVFTENKVQPSPDPRIKVALQNFKY